MGGSRDSRRGRCRAVDRPLDTASRRFGRGCARAAQHPARDARHDARGPHRRLRLRGGQDVSFRSTCGRGGPLRARHRPGTHYAAVARQLVHRALSVHARRPEQRQLLFERSVSDADDGTPRPGLSHRRIRQLVHPGSPLRSRARIRRVRRSPGIGSQAGRQLRGRTPRRPDSSQGRRLAGAVRAGERRSRRSAVGSRPVRAFTPFFLWLHLYDPHEPYRPPQPFRNLFADRPYDGEIAFTDTIVASVMDRLDKLGLLSSTLIAIVGDHGESLGDHGEETHSMFVYKPALRVPLILWRPGRLPAGKVVEPLVRALDLAPTLLDIIGAPPLPGAEGRSLMPLVNGKAMPARARLRGDVSAALLHELVAAARARGRAMEVHRCAEAGALRPRQRSEGSGQHRGEATRRARRSSRPRS